MIYLKHNNLLLNWRVGAGGFVDKFYFCAGHHLWSVELTLEASDIGTLSE